MRNPENENLLLRNSVVRVHSRPAIIKERMNQLENMTEEFSQKAGEKNGQKRLENRRILNRSKDSNCSRRSTKREKVKWWRSDIRRKLLRSAQNKPTQMKMGAED